MTKEITTTTSLDIDTFKDLTKSLQTVTLIMDLLIELKALEQRKNIELTDKIGKSLDVDIDAISNSLPSTSQPITTLKGLFFDKLFPIFTHNMSNYMFFDNRYSEELAGAIPSIELKNVVRMNDLITTNMMIFYVILLNYKQYICNQDIQVKDKYRKELNMLFDKLPVSDLILYVDKECSTNLSFRKDDPNDMDVINMSRVLEELFKYVSGVYEGECFRDTMSTIQSFRKEFKNIVAPTSRVSRDKRDHLIIPESSVNLAICGHNYFMTDYSKNTRGCDISKTDVINSLSDGGDFFIGLGEPVENGGYEFVAHGKITNRKRKRSTYTHATDVDSDEDVHTSNDIYAESRYTEREENTDFTQALDNIENNLEDGGDNNMISLASTLDSLRSKMREIQGSLSYDPNQVKFMSDIGEIYDQFNEIMIKLQDDIDNIGMSFNSSYDETTLDLIKKMKKDKSRKMIEIFCLDKNLDMVTFSLLHAIPYQNKLTRLINNTLNIIQGMVNQVGQIENILVSHDVIMLSLTKLHMNVIAGSNMTFQLINFLPIEMAKPLSTFVSMTFTRENITSMSFQMLQSNYFLSICGFVVSPLDILILQAEDGANQDNRNSSIVKLMTNTYMQHIDVLVRFLKIFSFEILKTVPIVAAVPNNPPEKRVYLNLNYIPETSARNLKNVSTAEKSTHLPGIVKLKDLTTHDQKYIKFKDDYIRSLSVQYLSNQMGSSKSSVIAVETFFSMVEPLFIFSCISEDKSALQILNWLLDQSTYTCTGVGATDNSETRVPITTESPKVLESFIIRFAFFYLIFNGAARVSVATNDQLTLIFPPTNTILKKGIVEKLFLKKNVLQKLNNPDICDISIVQNPNTTYTVTVALAPQYDLSKRTQKNIFTVKEDYFITLADTTKPLPDLIDHLMNTSTTVTSTFMNSNFKTELATISTVGTPTTDLTTIDRCELFQYFHANMFSGILCQKVTAEKHEINTIVRHISQTKLVFTV